MVDKKDNSISFNLEETSQFLTSKKEINHTNQSLNSLNYTNTQPKQSMPYLHSIIDETGLGIFHYSIFFSAALLFFNDGNFLYELSFIYKPLDKFLHLTSFTKGLLTSSYIIGKIIGAILSNFITYQNGRKWPIITSTLITCIFSFLFMLFENFYWMIFCRMMIGISIEIALCLLLPNVTEMCPTKYREFVLVTIISFQRIGIIFYVVFFHVYISDFLNVKFYNEIWRDSIIISSSLTIFAFVIAFFSIEESPKYLMVNNKF